MSGDDDEHADLAGLAAFIALAVVAIWMILFGFQYIYEFLRVVIE